jgi:hypothetical protein
MAFLGKDPVRCKIFVGNKYLQQLKNGKYLGCETSYEYEKDIKKTTKIGQIPGIINNTLKSTSAQKTSRIEVHNALVLPFFYTEG